jgi:hypothetical protein
LVECCNFECVDPNVDWRHCGSCNYDCHATEEGNTCVGGECKCGVFDACPQPDEKCCWWVTWICSPDDNPLCVPP